MPFLPSSPFLTFLTLLFAIFQVTHSAALSKVQIDYYIDPTTSSPIQNGGKFQPFQSFPQAFLALKDQVQLFNSSKVTATLYCRESSELVFDKDSLFLLNIDASSGLEISISLKSYVPGMNTPRPIKPFIIQVKGPSGRLVFDLPNTKLIIEGIIFRFDFQQDVLQKELVIFEGENSEIVMSNCEFKGINLGSLRSLETVFSVQGERILIKRSKFEDMILPGNLFQAINGSDTTIKFELNEIRNVTIKKGSMLSAEGIYSLSFLSNNVTGTNGGVVSAHDCESAIIYQNNFTGIIGEYPIKLDDIESGIVSFNSFMFPWNITNNCQGIGFLKDIQILRLENITVQQYVSHTNAFYFTHTQKKTSLKPFVVIEKLQMIDNFLLTSGNAFLKGESEKIPVNIHLNHILFKNNTIRKDNGNISPKRRGSSTIWIEGAKSEIQLSKGTFKDNTAEDGSCNFYANVTKILISRAFFYNNTQKSGNAIDTNIDIVATSMEVFESDFRKNTGVYGGALSIIQKPTAIKASIKIERSNFVENRAEIGGAFYLETQSNSPIELKGVHFENNQALIQGKNYNKDIKVSVENKKEIFLKVFLRENKTEKIYKSGELKVKNILPSELFYGPIEFFIAENPYKRRTSTEEYIASMNVLPSDNTREFWPKLKQGFKERIVGSNFSLESMTFKNLDGELNRVELVMESEEESYFFVIFLETNLKETLCERGETYLTTHNHCFRCPSNTYGLSGFLSTCKKCPPTANCSEGGYNLKLLPGYWRNISHDENVEIYHCGSNQKKCLGGLYSSCATGYTGAMCTACEIQGDGKTRYRKFIKGYCKECEGNLLGDIGMVVAPVAFLAYTLSILLEVNEKDKGINSPENRERVKLSILVNLFNNFIRGVFIVNSLGFNLPEFLSYFIHLLTNSTLPIINSIACYLDDPVQTGLSWYICCYLIVFMVKVIAALISLKMFIPVKTVSLNKAKMVIFTWVLYLESLGALDFLMSMITCARFPQSKFSSFDLLRECPDNGETSQIIGFIAFLGVLLILPLISLSLLEPPKTAHMQRLQAMMFGRSGEFIKHEHETGFFYFAETYKDLYLLVFSMLEMIFSTRLLLLMAYYTLVMLMNEHRKILFFYDKKSSLYLIEKYAIAILSGAAIIPSYGFLSSLYGLSYFVGLWVMVGYGLYVVGLIVHNCYYRIDLMDSVFGVSWIDSVKDKRRKNSLEENDLGEIEEAKEDAEKEEEDEDVQGESENEDRTIRERSRNGDSSRKALSAGSESD